MNNQQFKAYIIDVMLLLGSVLFLNLAVQEQKFILVAPVCALLGWLLGGRHGKI